MMQCAFWFDFFNVIVGLNFHVILWMWDNVHPSTHLRAVPKPFSKIFKGKRLFE